MEEYTINHAEHGSSGAPEEARRATGGAPEDPHDACSDYPDPEVLSKVRRRQFPAKYKLRILETAEKCYKRGEIGALLRREGLYSSHLTVWRRQRDNGMLSGLNPQKRGRKSKPVNPDKKENDALIRENAALRKKLRKAELIIDVQKKVSELLGIQLNPAKNEGDD
jgi:transposase